MLRRITWFGGDRRVVGFMGLLLFLVGLTFWRGMGVFYGLPFIVPSVIWIGVLWVAREANKADPWMVDVMLRQFRYRKYYQPKPDYDSEHPAVQDFH